METTNSLQIEQFCKEIIFYTKNDRVKFLLDGESVNVEFCSDNTQVVLYNYDLNLSVDCSWLIERYRYAYLLDNIYLLEVVEVLKID